MKITKFKWIFLGASILQNSGMFKSLITETCNITSQNVGSSVVCVSLVRLYCFLTCTSHHLLQAHKKVKTWGTFPGPSSLSCLHSPPSPRALCGGCRSTRTHRQQAKAGAMPTLPGSSPRQHISSYTWTSSGHMWTPGCNRDPGLSQGDLQFIKPTT